MPVPSFTTFSAVRSANNRAAIETRDEYLIIIDP
jgi:hypothetical protein